MSILIDQKYVTLTPAYGRDYANVHEVNEAFAKGNDFILQDVTSRWYGKPCNVMDFAKGTKVRIRYNKNRSVTIVEVS